MFTATTPCTSKLVVAELAAKGSMTETRRGAESCFFI